MYQDGGSIWFLPKYEKAGGVDQAQKMEMNERGKINWIENAYCWYIMDKQKGLLLILVANF
jgi:hypothetical protein